MFYATTPRVYLNVMLNVVTVSVAMLNAKCRYAEYRNAECRYTRVGCDKY